MTGAGRYKSVKCQMLGWSDEALHSVSTIAINEKINK